MTREDIEKKMHEAAEEIKPLVTTLVEALCEAHQKGYLAGVELGVNIGHPHLIPVEEKLPEENTTPLVRMDLSDKFNEETIIYDVVVFDQNGFHTPYKVTHWMEIQPPLPKRK